MKRFVFALLLFFSVPAWAAPAGISARAWVLVDQASGRELAAHQADLPLPPASLAQMMTAYVLLGDLRDKKLALDGSLKVPEIATQADGARIFLKAGETARVETLLQAMLTGSASDAVLTLVLAVDDSEAAFAARMNREAKRLGMTRSRFVNATGLPAPGQQASARDLAILARALIRDFPDRLVWFAQRELSFGGLTIYNGNRLLWRDATVDGLKAGRSADAGWCLAASARRGDQRRIAVVLGARGDSQRSQDALKLLNYGFENFDSALLYRAQQPVKVVNLYRGTRATVSLGFLQDFHLLAPHGSLARVKAEVVTRQPLMAPVSRGQPLGTLRLTLDGQVLGEYPLVALHDVSVAGVLGRGWDSIRLLFGR